MEDLQGVRRSATPVAFLIGEDGVIAQNVATGMDAILALARGELATNGEERHGRTVR